MNRFGYDLLRAGSVSTPVRVFELIVESHVESVNAYDSLGEGYWNARRYEESLSSYRRCLELDPEHGNARRMVGILEEKLAGEP